MDKIIADLAPVIRSAILRVATPVSRERPSTLAICEALKVARSQLKNYFGGPVKCRYAGCPPVDMDGKREKVLEYLWDFSFSRFKITQATEQRGQWPSEQSKYEILLVAESELGTAHEICRDLLKLLEARATVRCLIFRQPKRARQREVLQKRMLRIMHRHRYFDPRSESWLFLGLCWGPGQLSCDAYTLNEAGTAFSQL
jgi:hypothetical protein